MQVTKTDSCKAGKEDIRRVLVALKIHRNAKETVEQKGVDTKRSFRGTGFQAMISRGRLLE